MLTYLFGSSAGHRGLVDSAILRRIRNEGYETVLMRTRRALDLVDRWAVDRFVEKERPEYVFLVAAKVGGILANSTYPMAVLRDNFAIGLSLIDAAYRYRVEKLLFLGSCCIYPKFAPNP